MLKTLKHFINISTLILYIRLLINLTLVLFRIEGYWFEVLIKQGYSLNYALYIPTLFFLYQGKRFTSEKFYNYVSSFLLLFTLLSITSEIILLIAYLN